LGFVEQVDDNQHTKKDHIFFVYKMGFSGPKRRRLCLATTCQSCKNTTMEEKIPVFSSELNDYFFCPRQVYLKQILNLAENRAQAEGRAYHKRVQADLIREAKEKWLALLILLVLLLFLLLFFLF